MLGLALGAARSARPREVEIVHWWTSGGEAAALKVLKKNLREARLRLEGQPGRRRRRRSGPDRAARARRGRQSARRHADAGLHHHRLRRSRVLLGDLTPRRRARKAGTRWCPPPLQKFAKYNGHWVAAPVNIHSHQLDLGQQEDLRRARRSRRRRPSTSCSPRRQDQEGRLHPARARRPALAGRHHLRQRRAVRRRPASSTRRR